MIKLFIFIIIFTLFFIIDIFTRFLKCKNSNLKILLLIFFHRLFYTFIYYAWIFDNKIILILCLFLIIFTYIHWYFNNWKCKQTEIENNICNYDKYMNFDYFYIIFNEKIADLIINSYFIITLCIILYKLFKN